MNKLPDFLTVDHLAEYIKEAVGLRLTTDAIIEYGRSELLNFVVANKGTQVTKLACYRIDGELCKEDTNIITKHPEITATVLEIIFDSDTPYRLEVVSNEVDGKYYEYIAIPRMFYTKQDLRVAKREATRFVTYLSEPSDNDNVTYELAWKVLFVSEFNSEDFRYYSTQVDDFMKRHNQLPKSHNELFNFMKKESDNFLKLPNGKTVTLNSFRNNWNKYTAKYGDKPL